MGLFESLDIGYSGLNVNQAAMTTLSHNISNANNEAYSRQRVIIESQTPLNITPGEVGRGSQIAVVERIHDEFVFGRLKTASTDLEFNKYSSNILQEVAQYFPDLDDVGLARDLENYHKAWNDLASNPNDASQKVNLAQMALTLSDNIKNSRNKLTTMQDTLNEKIKSHINEINEIGEKIAKINADIGKVESIEANRANDLRDKRDQLEMTLAKLLDFDVYKGDMISNSIYQDTTITDVGFKYHLNIAGHSFVDGATYHPLTIKKDDKNSRFYSIYYQSQDQKLIDMTADIKGGQVGAMLALRGGRIDPVTNQPEDGYLQEYIEDLDSFANTLIVQTNNIYATSASTSMITPILKDYKPNTALTSTDDHINTGTFDVVVYDKQGNEVARREINIDINTVMDSDDGSATPPYTGNSIVSQINRPDVDDNSDNDSTNDVDDYFKAVYMYDESGGTLTIQETDDVLGLGYTVAIEDHGTNFAGTVGLNQFFTGNNAKNIDLRSKYKDNPADISPSRTPVDGDNEVANDMVQLQYNDLKFYKSNDEYVEETLNGFYKYLTTKIGSQGETYLNAKDTSEALYNTVYQEQQSISGVNIDEELAQLIKFQTGYGAAAKVITTVDQMLNTLLGIKQ